MRPPLIAQGTKNHLGEVAHANAMKLQPRPNVGVKKKKTNAFLSMGL